MPPNPPPDPVVLRAHATDAQCASFDARRGARALETGDADGVIVTWDTTTRRAVGRRQAHAPASGVLAMRDVAIRTTGDASTSSRAMRVTQGKDGSLKFWRRGDGDDGDATEMVERAVYTRVHGFCRVASDCDDLIAFAGDARGTIVVMRASNGNVACGTPAVGSEDDDDDPKVGVVMCVRFVRSTHLLAGYEDGTVILWALNFESGVGEIVFRRRAHGETALCVDVDAGGEGAVTGGADGVLVRYAIDFVTESEVNVRVVRTHGPYTDVVSASSKQPGVSACSIRRDGKIVACGCWDGKIRVFEYKARSKGRLLAVLKYHDATVTDVLFAPDDSFLVSTSRDGAVAMWNIF